MMTLSEKISYLEDLLNRDEENYADSFKTDILFFFDDFSESNPMFQFLGKINSKDKVEDWVNKLTSRIVMRLDEEQETTSDLIADYFYNG